MPLEIEAKIRVVDHAAVRAALVANGGQRLGVVRERNVLFDDRTGRLKASGCGLRIREPVTLEGPERPSTLTFKGRVAPGSLKIRPEHETAVGDPDSAARILEGLGFVPLLRFEKQRETWRLASCTVELDTLPLLGTFVEVEGPTTEAVLGLLGRLGLDREPLSTTSYMALLLAASGGRTEFRLDDPAAGDIGA